MAAYGRARLEDLGAAVDRLPTLLPGAETTSSAYTTLPQTPDRGRGPVRTGEETEEGRGGNVGGLNPLQIQGVEASCGQVKLVEESSPSRTRTYNKPVNRSRLVPYPTALRVMPSFTLRQMQWPLQAQTSKLLECLEIAVVVRLAGRVTR
jgi:hypothetical protein